MSSSLERVDARGLSPCRILPRHSTARMWGTLVALFLAYASCAAQSQLLPTGARSMALGGTSAALLGDPEAIFHNPATLAGVARPQISLFYQRPFGLRDLSLATAALGVPFHSLHLGIGLYTFGNSLFRQQAAVFGVAMPLARGLHSAVSVAYTRTAIEGYGAAGSLGLNLAVLARPVPGLDWGFYVRQRRGQGSAGGNSAAPGEIAVGLGYHLGPELYVIGEVFDEPQFEPDFRFGVEWRAGGVLVLRAGGGLAPERFSAGFGLRKFGLGLDYAFFTHSDLGITHQFGIVLAVSGPRQESVHADAPGDEPPLRVDLNTATERDLRALPGVGPLLAARILAYRAEHGPFHALEDLLRVPGIGRKTFERLRPFLRLERARRP